MKEVLLSTRPKWCVKIGNNEKKIEVRKTRPKEQEPFRVLIYCTKTNSEQALLLDKNGRLSFGDYRNASSGDYYIADGKVIGEFVCNKVDEYKEFSTFIKFNYIGLPEGLNKGYIFFEDDLKAMCLSYDEVKEYGKGKTLYGWHISNLVIYDKPKKLSDFYKLCPTKEEFDCGNCEHFEQYVCTNYLTRPPQSWQYVLEK